MRTTQESFKRRIRAQMAKTGERYGAARRALIAGPGEMLLDDTERGHLFPGYETVLRSRPTAKALRVAIGPGVAMFSFDPHTHGRTRATVTHERLGSPDDVEEWKSYWVDWLEALHDPGEVAASGGASEGTQR